MPKIEELQELQPVLRQAQTLHRGVYYGTNLDMYDQVRRCGEIALEQTGDIELAKLALLHKSQDIRRIKDGKALPLATIERDYGSEMATLVKALSLEPLEPRDNKQALFAAKLAWAKNLPPKAQQALMIEKIVNFETSLTHPRSDWAELQHADYIRTRMPIIEACKNASPALYSLACKLRDEGLSKFGPAAASDPLAMAASGEKSWGDKYKKFAFNKVTYVGINYFVNAIGSAALTYATDTKFRDNFLKLSETLANKFATHPHGVEKLSGGIFRGIRGFFLTLVGTLLVPIIKGLEDHRKSIEFRFGHMLDVIQEGLGRGNDATRQNMQEYDKIRLEMKSHGSVQFTEEEKHRIWEKHKLEITDRSKSFAFRERKLPWTKVLLARLVGWTAANATAFGLGLTDNNNNPMLRYKYHEEKLAPKIGSVLSKIPGFKKVFSDTNLFGKLLLQDAIMTVSSSTTHAIVQGKLHNAKHADDDEELTSAPSKSDAHKKILADGPRDFRARTEKTAAEASANTASL